MALWDIVGTPKVAAANSATVSVTLDASPGIVSSNLLWAFCHANEQHDGPPSGWLTAVESSDPDDTGNWIAVYYKIATGSEGLSVSVTATGSSRSRIHVHQRDTQGQAVILYDHDHESHFNNTWIAWDLPPLTVPAGALLLGGVGLHNNAGTWGAWTDSYTGMTSHTGGGANPASNVAYFVAPSSGTYQSTANWTTARIPHSAQTAFIVDPEGGDPVESAEAALDFELSTSVDAVTPAVEILDPPAGLAQTDATDTTISMRWDSVERATKYAVRRDGVFIGYVDVTPPTVYELDADIDTSISGTGTGQYAWGDLLLQGYGFDGSPAGLTMRITAVEDSGVGVTGGRWDTQIDRFDGKSEMLDITHKDGLPFTSMTLRIGMQAVAEGAGTEHDEAGEYDCFDSEDNLLTTGYLHTQDSDLGARIPEPDGYSQFPYTINVPAGTVRVRIRCTDWVKWDTRVPRADIYAGSIGNVAANNSDIALSGIKYTLEA